MFFSFQGLADIGHEIKQMQSLNTDEVLTYLIWFLNVKTINICYSTFWQIIILLLRQQSALERGGWSAGTSASGSGNAQGAVAKAHEKFNLMNKIIRFLFVAQKFITTRNRTGR